MEINLPDNIVETFGEQALKEIIAVTLYKMNKINGVTGGKIIGKSEIEFHGLLEKYGETVGYSSEDLFEDMDKL